MYENNGLIPITDFKSATTQEFQLYKSFDMWVALNIMLDNIYPNEQHTHEYMLDIFCASGILSFN